MACGANYDITDIRVARPAIAPNNKLQDGSTADEHSEVVGEPRSDYPDQHN
ncbi:hypothetical protein H6F98_11395 [Microcoleus sp. FACHB-SPT15]|uniref:hypothetical protein n=1 Tax=Microcoleus sp. FACHB-SPT15 TaxID=2692830 RepID=UPI001782EF21|nr:hypothetical protein [Microcoleus sp. FACHB-SPT15]MBD1806052.1 hypothetical protein [Microcoleus sp. FACHB-SPT15]